MLVLPAIHRFDFFKAPRYKKWGWHRTHELVEAVNTVLSLKGSPGNITSQNIYEHYYHLNTMRDNSYKHIAKPSIFFLVRGNRYIEIFDRSAYPLEDTDFVPAKWGLAIINAIEHPVVHAAKQRVRRIAEFVSVDSNPLTRARLM